MTIVTVDAAMRDNLLHLVEQAEVRDQDGELLGYFQPATVEVRDPTGQFLGHFKPATKNGKSMYEGYYVPDFSKEDLDRWANEPGGRSLKEILADLEKRA